MFTATETAVNNLKNYLEANNMQTGIRITCRQGKRLKPGLGMVFSNAKENDQSFELQGVRFVVNRELLAKSGGISLDYIDHGPDKGYFLSPIDPSAVCAH
jgi:iron-sulfur cluster assembly protein